MPQSSDEAGQIQTVIHDFLQERLQAKLDKLKEGDDEQCEKLRQDYQPENWIPDAARRVGQIQQITHALKYIHPDAKGTNLNAPGNPDADERLVGTHTIAGQYSPDVVGNAAALDVYKFLRLEVADKTLLARATASDPALRQVFSADEALAEAWMQDFAKLTQSKGEPASHKLAKQLYWPVPDGNYHLLAPLFPTALVHQVWSIIREDRFSEEAKAAREARHANAEHPHGYSEYPGMVIQQFGGTKPQNISQLNSERYGENYLLRSCPPDWVSQPVRPPLKVESVFDGWFIFRPQVKKLVDDLRDYLYGLPDKKTNMRIRNKRIQLMGYIVDEMLLYAAELRDLEEVWTLHEDCKLNIDEQCWFNPIRVKTDPEFSKTYTWGDWKDNVYERFANWLNAQLIKKKKPLPFGEDEARQWKSDLKEELRLLRLEVDSYE